MSDEPDREVSLEEASRMIGIRKSTVSSYCSQGILDSILRGRRRYILKSTLDAYIAKRSATKAAAELARDPDPPSPWDELDARDAELDQELLDLELKVKAIHLAMEQEAKRLPKAATGPTYPALLRALGARSGKK